MKIKVNKNIPQCPACDSTNVLTKQTGHRYCRRCGAEWEKKVDKPSKVRKQAEV